MKKMICMLLAVLMAFAVYTGDYTADVLSASAEIGYGEIYITGDVNVRDEPSLDGQTLRTLKAGSTVPYAGQQATDDRGVVWYMIYFSDGSTGWMSSKYAQIDDRSSGKKAPSTAVGSDLYTYVERIPGGRIYTREQVAEWYGIFNYKELINVDHVETDLGNGKQTLRVFLEEDVFWGGTDGYADDWLATDGILTEGVADIDRDGAEEYLVLYVDSNYVTEYDYTSIQNVYTFAVFEPVDGGYMFADDMVIDPGYMNERFISYFEGADANYIVQGNIGYWDGGAGGIYADLYGYDGKKLYGAAVFIASTDGSYAFTVRCEPEDMAEMVDECTTYYFDEELAAKWGLEEGSSFVYVEGCYDIWDYDTGKLNKESFVGIDVISQMAAGMGLDMGYIVEEGEWEGYDLYMNAGANMYWADEVYENGADCVQLELFGYLDYSGESMSID